MKPEKTYLDLPIGGFMKQSLIDYPGNISAVVFTAGCNFRCNYCHNPELVNPDIINKSEKFDVATVITWIENNRLLLDAVTISGGEPTIHQSLIPFIKKIKELDVKVKLDTNGTNPDMLSNLVKEKLLDYVAMDIKAPLHLKDYQNIAGQQFDKEMLDHVQHSITLLQTANVNFEFRSTLTKTNHTMKDALQIAGSVRAPLYFQQFQTSPAIKDLKIEPFQEFTGLKERFHHSGNVRFRD